MLLGQSRGKEVRVMVHHSRNTEQKQWDETVVIALGGMARLLRAHLPAIVGMDRVAGELVVGGRAGERQVAAPLHPACAMHLMRRLYCCAAADAAHSCSPCCLPRSALNLPPQPAGRR